MLVRVTELPRPAAAGVAASDDFTTGLVYRWLAVFESELLLLVENDEDADRVGAVILRR